MALTAAELRAAYTVDESELHKSLGGLGGLVKGAMAGLAGLGLGKILADGIFTGLDNEKVTDKLAAQLGGGSPMAASAGKIAGQLYGQAYGESLGEAADAVRSVLQGGLLPEDATDGQIQRMTAKVLDLSTTFEQDLGGTTNAVAQMIRTGLAKDGNEALDILTRGFQQGGDKAGDLLDTVNEYSTQFRKLGIDGTTAMGLISQGLQAGARDSDLVADAIKEFSIRAVDGSQLTADSFKGIGLNAQTMSEQIAQGGPQAQAALAQVLNGLRGIEDPAKRAQLATGLFGTQAEDLGAALFALDPSKAVGAMGQVAGAADKMGKTLNDNASTNLESFKRQAMQAFVNILGGKVLPVVSNVVSFLVTNFGPAVSAVGGWITGTLVPALQSAAQWVERNQTPLTIIAGIILAVFLPAMIAAAAQSLLTGATMAAMWVASQVGAIQAAAVHSAQIVRMVAGWVLLGAQALIQGARMAAAWVLAMGPVGWVIAAVVGLVALIVANWDTVVSWTKTAWEAVTGAVSAAWEWIKGAVKAALDFVVNLFLNFTGPGLIIKHWQTIVDFTRSLWNNVVGAVSGAWNAVVGAVSAGVSNVISFVQSLPGRIMGAIGNLGSLLLNAGRDLLTGLWNGIKNAGSWLLGKIGSFFGSLLPGWVRDMLGIHSPSTVFAEMGRYLMLGMASGIESEQSTAVKAALAAAGAITDAMQVSAPDLSAMANRQAMAGLTARRPAGVGPPTPGGQSPATPGDPSGRGPLFHADTVTVIEGTPTDVARQLELGARTRGNW